ncbi:hypothetical protein ASG87_17775 [Frateuria sp. Soil773]|uniref:FHA domain-containing protein n=1 Tax=Frateuria sp. Soil773 TaxID=1736407 RepID=UPI0006F899F6|nr:FHA domain-containing protein [Frateuria sp. Soil773]KRE94451.1 hypothetical protein ASG87_17775 [Frateuria sp. Soil773]
MSRPAAQHRSLERTAKVQLSLRVFSGVHAGAEVRLPQRGILMIGQADDCDLILADPAIAAHHCVLTAVGDQVLLRAMEGTVETDDGSIAVGENISLEHFALVRLGDVQFAVGPHWSAQWQHVADSAGDGVAALTEKQMAGRRRGVLAVVGLLLLVAALVLFGSWQVTHPVALPERNVAQQLEQVRGILKQMSLFHVSATSGAGDRLLVRGVVGNAAQLPQLKQRLGAAGLITELSVRDWPSVASQVRDIFAMHGYTVESHLLDTGGIEVTGHFGDPAHAEKVKREVLGSADMQNLNTDALGLSMALKNVDEGKPEPPKADPGKRIRRVISGDEPYLVTADQSRYYPGNPLPQGGVFLSVDERDDVLVRLPDGSIKQLEKSDEYQKLHDLDPSGMAAAITPAPAGSAAPSSSAAEAPSPRP